LAPSNNNASGWRSLGRAEKLDRAALVGIALGIALYVLPLGGGLLKYGFWLTLLSTFLHIYTSSVAPAERAARAAASKGSRGGDEAALSATGRLG
jgi:hypothetical protein